MLELLDDGLDVDDEALEFVCGFSCSSQAGSSGGPVLFSSLVRPCGDGMSKVTCLIVGGVRCS